MNKIEDYEWTKGPIIKAIRDRLYGYWWDVDDKTSRIEVLSILIDIYERKLNDENLYYIE